MFVGLQGNPRPRSHELGNEKQRLLLPCRAPPRRGRRGGQGPQPQRQHRRRSLPFLLLLPLHDGAHQRPGLLEPAGPDAIFRRGAGQGRGHASSSPTFLRLLGNVLQELETPLPLPRLGKGLENDPIRPFIRAMPGCLHPPQQAHPTLPLIPEATRTNRLIEANQGRTNAFARLLLAFQTVQHGQGRPPLALGSIRAQGMFVHGQGDAATAASFLLLLLFLPQALLQYLLVKKQGLGGLSFRYTGGNGLAIQPHGGRQDPDSSSSSSSSSSSLLGLGQQQAQGPCSRQRRRGGFPPGSRRAGDPLFSFSSPCLPQQGEDRDA